MDAQNKFEQASALLAENGQLKTEMWRKFWCAHQRFFKYLCISSKVSYAVKVAKQAVKDGKCVVIGLQTTGQNSTQAAINNDDDNDGEGEFDGFISTAK